MATEGPLVVAVLSRHHLIREGLRALVRGTAGYAVEADAAGHRDLRRPEVAVYDLAGLVHGPSLRELHRVRRTVSVVGLSREARGDLDRSARALGLHHLVDEDAGPSELLAALERAAGRRGEPAGGAPAGLTPREQGVLALVGEGLNNRQISERLFVSPNTVKTYIRTAYSKIGVRDRSHAVLWAVEHVRQPVPPGGRELG